MTSGLRSGGTINGLLKVLAGHRLSRSAKTDEVLQSEYLKFSQLIFVRENAAAINCVKFSPEGTLIVSGSSDGTRIASGGWENNHRYY
jgi:WD40 repeat protein